MFCKRFAYKRCYGRLWVPNGVVKALRGFCEGFVKVLDAFCNGFSNVVYGFWSRVLLWSCVGPQGSRACVVEVVYGFRVGRVRVL